MANAKVSKIREAFPADLLADIARSGLNEDDAKSMRLEYKDAEWAGEHLGIERPGYKIPYFDFDGGLVDEMYRFRFLDFNDSKPRGGRFGAQANHQKYSQPSGTRPYVYFSKRIDWKAEFADKTTRILFTEGEKKAEAACRFGFTCIGLGGVYSFRSAVREWMFLPELDALDWKGRDVDVCYDSDVMTKKEVHSALTALTEQLVQRGARVHFIYLPSKGPNDKIGLDDFLVDPRYGVAAFKKLERVHSLLSAAIHQLNEEAGFLKIQGRYWLFEENIFMDEAHARAVLSPLVSLQVASGRAPKKKDDGTDIEPPKKEIPAFDIWIKHKQRRTMRGVAYVPGNHQQITENNDVNVWKAPLIKPKRGLVKPWLELVDYVFREPKYVKWFLQWLAYPLIVPGTKHYSAVFVHSRMEGTGKSLVLSPLGDSIYGENFQRVENKKLDSAFNAAYANKQMVMIDEVYAEGRNDRIGVLSTLKDMITREKYIVNQKNEKEYTVIDYTNYYFTSNHADALPINENDRRFFIIHAPEEKLPQSFYREIDDQLRNGAMASHILYHLLNKIDISDFDPKMQAMRTEYRDEVVYGSLTTVDEFALRLANNPEGIIDRTDITRMLVTAESLLEIYQYKYPKAAQATAQAMGRALTRHIEQIPKREVRLSNTSPKYTLYALFEKALWGGKPSKEWAQYHEITLRGGK